MGDKYKIPHYDPASFDLKAELTRYLQRWKWFVLLQVIFISLAFLYLKYANVYYETSAKIKVLDEASKAFELPDDIASFFESSKVNLENEIEVIKSVNLLQNVVKSLGLNVSYYEEGKIKSKELYVAPIKVVPVNELSDLPESGRYSITLTPTGYEVINAAEKVWNVNAHSMTEVVEGLPFLIDITSPELIDRHMGKTYGVNFRSSRKTAMSLSSALSVTRVGKMSDVLSISIVGESVPKSEAIINEILFQFDLDGIKDRQLVSQRTIDFVDKRFITLTQELDSIEDDKKDYKQNNSLTDIGLDTEYTIVRKANRSDEVIKYQTQLEIANLLKDVLDKQNDFSLLPANIGLENAGINTLIHEYNVIVLNLEKLSKSAGENNPVKIRLKRDLEGLKRNISKSVAAFEKQTNAALRNAQKVSSQTNGLFSGIPQKEQFLRAIERQQTIKETLYILLLQKREEAAINLAVTSPSIKVVDYAMTNGAPVSPNSKKIYLIAILSALLIPIILLYTIFLLDNRIYTKDDVQSITKDGGSVIAEIPWLGKNGAFSLSFDESLKIESYRNLRTNIEYELKHLKNRGKIIYVTSTIKGEGKTFNAVNLAESYAALKRKTLLIGSDFRNPQMHKILNIQNEPIGLSSYLNGDYESVMDLVNGHVSNEGHVFNILLPGHTPPEPAELLANGRFELALQELAKVFDHIIIDSAPILSVSDTLFIAPQADMTLYLVRSNFSERKFINICKDVEMQNKLNNVRYLLNGVKLNDMYGYKYNYGYYYDYKTSWPRQFITRLFNKPNKPVVKE
ncbi:MAG: GumC family protein [bacterium]